jgi:hypothetical protein
VLYYFPCTNGLNALKERLGVIVLSSSTFTVVPCTIAIEDNELSVLAALGPGEVSVERLVWIFEGMRGTSAPVGHVGDVEGGILDGVRRWRVIIGDVDALLYDARLVGNADIACDWEVMNALATNIAFFHARGVVGEVGVEDMLMHIVSVDPQLFDVVVRKIEGEKHVQRLGLHVVSCPCIRPAHDEIKLERVMPRRSR